MCDNNFEFALMLTLQFVAYLRPSELVNLAPSQVVEPKGTEPHGALLLAPEEEGIPSKTRQFDESVILDRDDIPGLFTALSQQKARRHGATTLWSIGFQRYGELFKKYSAASGVSCLQPHPYSVRHGGASDDALRRRRTMLEIKMRGRWAADASIRRYMKHARLLKEIERLPAVVRAYGEKVASVLSECLDQTVRSPTARRGVAAPEPRLRARR